MQDINDGFNYFLSTIRALSDALTITDVLLNRFKIRQQLGFGLYDSGACIFGKNF